MNTKREILEDVAAGRLSPQEAAERLAALDTGEAPAATPPASAAPPSDLTKVKLITALGSAHVIGDPTVADAVAEGEHTATREGDVLTIEVTQEEAEDGEGQFRFESSRKRFVIGGKRVTFGSHAHPKVTIRMNPRLALDAEVGAGKLTVKDVHGPIAADVAMGSLRVDGARAPFDIEVAMGSAHVSGRLDHGEASVRCDMGSAHIELEQGSSVKVRGRTSMGKVALPGVAPSSGIGGGVTEATVGGGDARLEIECAMGSVKVNAQ
jgi:hypothetical protein